MVSRVYDTPKLSKLNYSSVRKQRNNQLRGGLRTQTLRQYQNQFNAQLESANLNKHCYASMQELSSNASRKSFAQDLNSHSTPKKLSHLKLPYDSVQRLASGSMVETSKRTNEN